MFFFFRNVFSFFDIVKSSDFSRRNELDYRIFLLQWNRSGSVKIVKALNKSPNDRAHTPMFWVFIKKASSHTATVFLTPRVTFGMSFCFINPVLATAILNDDRPRGAYSDRICEPEVQIAREITFKVVFAVHGKQQKVLNVGSFLKIVVALRNSVHKFYYDIAKKTRWKNRLQGPALRRDIIKFFIQHRLSLTDVFPRSKIFPVTIMMIFFISLSGPSTNPRKRWKWNVETSNERLTLCGLPHTGPNIVLKEFSTWREEEWD